MIKFILQISICVLVSFQCVSQHVYWVSFTGKDSAYSITHPERFLSEKAIARRAKYGIVINETDLPVNNYYIAILKGKGYGILSRSKWLNAAAIQVVAKNDLDSIRLLPFVKNITYMGEHHPVKSSRETPVDLNEMITALDSKFERKKQPDSVFYGKSFGQVSMLNVQQLHNLGYMGNTVSIAVIDAGFNSVNKLPVFKHLVDSQRIKTTVDFVQKDQNVFDDDDHGMSVLSCMAGFIPYQYVGTAPFADYYLLRSEYAATEMPVEETYWLQAAEYADSCGVDLINSSLGYNEFDQASLSHTYKELNGKKAVISQGAYMAVAKGIIVLNSAGNEGNDAWHFISVPADVEEVITVGGVDAKRNYASFSSVGPTADKRIKPDIMAQGDNAWVASARGVFYQGDGTSYACPIMTGAVACLLQANYSKTPAQIMKALKLSGDRYHDPDKYLGYGVPDIFLAHLILKSDPATTESLLDFRVLDDKKIHITYAVSSSQKVIFTLRNTLDDEVFTETVSLKQPGAHRFVLKKSKKLKKGTTYSLQVSSKDKSSTQVFNYK